MANKWKEFLKLKENKVNEIFGLFGKPNPRKKGQYAKAYEMLLKKYNNNEEQANAEFDKLAANPMGQHQLLKMMSQMGQKSSEEEDNKYNQFNAKNTSGPGMFNQGN